MLLWIIFAGVTAAVLAAILMPLARASGRTMRDDAAFDLAVYRDQLTELEREKEAGLIPPAEADRARNEIGRRLLKTDRDQVVKLSQSSSTLPQMALIATALAVPIFVLGFYALRGSPHLPGVPHAERLANAEANRDLQALIAKAETHLAANPRDAAGWRALAPAYRSLGRYDLAARAYAQALTYGKPEASLYADLGEVMVMAGQGLVSRAAADSFGSALKLDAKNAKARYFAALAMFQEGKTDTALKEWQAMLDEAPADAPWVSLVERQIAAAKITAIAPKLDGEEIAAIEGATEEEKSRMIRSMVDGLAQRLEQDGGDLEGWLRLARARMVMGEPAQAKHALDRAGEIFKADAGAMSRIEGLRRSLRVQ
jgi:cytochrome c-type biogenesis protein CcmH